MAGEGSPEQCFNLHWLVDIDRWLQNAYYPMVEMYCMGQFGFGRQTETNVTSLMPVFLHTRIVSIAVSSYR